MLHFIAYCFQTFCVVATDMFLIGPPSPAKRRLAFTYAQLLGREVEYVCISRDTTDSDLKQRREISGGTSTFVDQAPVRAALQVCMPVLRWQRTTIMWG